MTEEEELENTRKLFANHTGIDARDVRWYHSILDPEAKVIWNDKGEILIRDRDMWKAFVGDVWIKPT